MNTANTRIESARVDFSSVRDLSNKAAANLERAWVDAVWRAVRPSKREEDEFIDWLNDRCLSMSERAGDCCKLWDGAWDGSPEWSEWDAELVSAGLAEWGDHGGQPALFPVLPERYVKAKAVKKHVRLA